MNSQLDARHWSQKKKLDARHGVDAPNRDRQWQGTGAMKQNIHAFVRFAYIQFLSRNFLQDENHTEISIDHNNTRRLQ
jgi:hypothetical protein